MNVDKDDNADEGEGEGDETGPGCFIFKFGIPGIWRSELLVRKEYIRLYEYCDKYLESRRNNQKPPSVVITGQPGIGKSYWLTYALCRRLTEGGPVIWFRSAKRYLFVDEGVFVVPPDYPSTDFKTRIWTLVDADDKDGIPDCLAALQETNHLIISSSSPKSSRWKLLTRSTLCSVAYMNPWKREEISKAGVIHGLSANDPRIDEMYDQYGPTPRICLESVCTKAIFAAHKNRLDSTLRKLSVEKLENMAFDTVNSSLDDESYTLILVTRLPRDGDDDDKFAYSRVEPITHMIKLKIRNQLRTETRAARIRLYKTFTNVEGTRRIAGVVYESLAQEILEKKIALKLVPMIKMELSEFGRKLNIPRWHSNHGVGANRSLVLPIDITPTETFVYPVSGLDHPIKDKVYYAPESQNQVAFDSFIMAEGKLYIFQFTIGSEHSIKKGIVPLFSTKVQGALPPRADWHFVLVVPPSVSKIYCSPELQDNDLKELLDEMNLFSMVLDCEAE
ncbi:hypothetical protein EDB92DRAFT_1793737 [Lactarius akahatsu]|uniref:Crinkler (CRN) family protein n=1 Tax=Lactarius akahatsu TaxID=416441 RepID=A0AAD4LMT0_9AGAM|nr:hypothetical protein EDB92DRAFT_1793737 [Lactarius akahatsu]